MALTLAKALRLSSFPSIAFVGAGGKTTAMFQLARELPEPVIVTSTTHIGAWQIPLADRHIVATSPNDLENITIKYIDNKKINIHLLRTLSEKETNRR